MTDGSLELGPIVCMFCRRKSMSNSNEETLVDRYRRQVPFGITTVLAELKRKNRIAAGDTKLAELYAAYKVAVDAYAKTKPEIETIEASFRRPETVALFEARERLMQYEANLEGKEP